MDNIQTLNLKAKTFMLEAAMKQFPQVEIPVKHYFSFGVYAREMYVPKGACVVGKLHKYQNLNILSKGVLLVTIDDKVERLEAPYTFVANAGSKRAFYAEEDSVWTVIHGTHEKDIDEIERYFIAQNEREYLEFAGFNQLALELTK